MRAAGHLTFFETASSSPPPAQCQEFKPIFPQLPNGQRQGRRITFYCYTETAIAPDLSPLDLACVDNFTCARPLGSPRVQEFLISVSDLIGLLWSAPCPFYCHHLSLSLHTEGTWTNSSSHETGELLRDEHRLLAGARLRRRGKNYSEMRSNRISTLEI